MNAEMAGGRVSEVRCSEKTDEPAQLLSLELNVQNNSHETNITPLMYVGQERRTPATETIDPVCTFREKCLRLAQDYCLQLCETNRARLSAGEGLLSSLQSHLYQVKVQSGCASSFLSSQLPATVHLVNSP